MKVDLVPRLHLHPHLQRGSAGVPGPWLAAGYAAVAAAEAGFKEKNPGRGFRRQARIRLRPTKWSEVAEVCFAGTLCTEARNGLGLI